MAKRCIVPARKNGSLMSPVNAVRQPSVIAQSSRSGSSSAGSPSASVCLDQFKKRSVNGGVDKVDARSCQLLVELGFELVSKCRASGDNRGNRKDLRPAVVVAAR